MTNEEFVGQLLAPYGPRQEIGPLVVEVNRIYHAFEARDYDRRHPEITAQLPPIWRAMIAQAETLRPAQGWRILDFGCGTGFEAAQLLRHLAPGNVAALVCYDPSAEMLARCRARIAPLYPATRFCTGLDELPEDIGGYNLLATNSLLHHLPSPLATINGLLPRLAADALWLAGHEPSSRYFTNPACQRAYQDFLQWRRLRRYFQPGAYVTRLEMALGARSHPTRQTAQEAHRRGLFEQRPPPQLIGRLVDFYVAWSADEAAAGRGLDFVRLEVELAPAWQLAWVHTYGFMGLSYEGELPPRWAAVCRDLRARYPQDGANFCTLWQRTSTVQEQ